MKTGEKFFIRIDKRIANDPVSEAIGQAHLRYLERLASEAEMFAGGFSDKPGGMVIFAAQDRSEAVAKCNDDPVIAQGYYAYDLYEWTLQLTGKL